MNKQVRGVRAAVQPVLFPHRSGAHRWARL